MTIAAQLPQSNLDIKGDRLRFLLAAAINECEQQYRNGATDKATNTTALLNAAIAKLNVLTTISSVALANLTADNIITAAEAASPVTAAITTTGVANGTVPVILLDGAVNAGVTASTLTAGAATLTMTSAVALALSIGTHNISLTYVDTAGVSRQVIKGFSRSA